MNKHGRSRNNINIKVRHVHNTTDTTQKMKWEDRIIITRILRIPRPHCSRCSRVIRVRLLINRLRTRCCGVPRRRRNGEYNDLIYEIMTALVCLDSEFTDARAFGDPCHWFLMHIPFLRESERVAIKKTFTFVDAAIRGNIDSALILFFRGWPVSVIGMGWG